MACWGLIVLDAGAASHAKCGLGMATGGCMVAILSQVSLENSSIQEPEHESWERG